ncbi:MAG: GPW/gp25 family protein [Anaerolineales bacterium]|nr:GPW/gp25 family protein [Anaerolineales bacterium]
MADLIGRGFAFPPQVDNRGQLALTSVENEIIQAIRVIIGTAPGERLMRPDFGCRIHELIFAPNNAETHAAAERYIREALGRWEPRINVEAVRVSMDAADSGGMLIEIDYLIKGTQDPRSLVYPFYLLPDQS